MSIQGALAASLRRFDPFPESLLTLVFKGAADTGHRPFYKREGIIYPTAQQVRGFSSPGGAGFSKAKINDAWRDVAADNPIIGGDGLVVPEGRTNKCANNNANPTDLTGVAKSGDAAATLSIVDDAAALVAAGLQGLCTSGKVYKLDNSAGSSYADALLNGIPGNTNPHTTSVFLRGSGIAAHGFNQAGPGGILAAIYLSPAYTRDVKAGVVPSAAGVTYRVRAAAGAIVHFILNQLEEGAFATDPIVVQGVAATRTDVQPLVSGLVIQPTHYGVCKLRWDAPAGASAGSFPTGFELTGASGSGTRVLWRRDNSGQHALTFRQGGTTFLNFGFGGDTPAPGHWRTLAWRCQAGGYAWSLDGSAAVSNPATTALGEMSTLGLMASAAAPLNIGNGTMARFHIWNGTISDAGLASLSASMANA